MRRTLLVSAIVLAIVVGAVAFAIQANSQDTRRAVPMPSTLVFPDGPKDFAWTDEDGRPAGVADENWIPVTDQLGVIWRAVPQQPDKIVWVVFRGGGWRAADTVEFAEFYPYQHGSTSE